MNGGAATRNTRLAAGPGGVANVALLSYSNKFKQGRKSQCDYSLLVPLKLRMMPISTGSTAI